MSDKFEDMPDGAGQRATDEDYTRIWRYMQSRNRKPTVRGVLVELEAQNFIAPSPATSARMAKRLGLSETRTPSITTPADKRVRKRRAKIKAGMPEVTTETVAEKTGETKEKVESALLTRMKALLKEENSSTQLAITENRTRMAFNVALMEFYAENPALLVNVRDTAAFVDAATIASKLSGGASIDITLPKPGEQDNGISPGGHAMRTVNPLEKMDGGLVASFNDFKAKLRDGAGS